METYSKNKEWKEFMDTIYDAAETKGATVALRKLKEKDKSYYSRHYKRLKPELELLRRAYVNENPEVYSPYTRNDFN